MRRAGLGPGSSRGWRENGGSHAKLGRSMRGADGLSLAKEPSPQFRYSSIWWKISYRTSTMKPRSPKRTCVPSVEDLSEPSRRRGCLWTTLDLPLYLVLHLAFNGEKETICLKMNELKATPSSH